MGLASGIMVYLIAWWLVFFMALPLGVKAQDEDGGEVVPGTPSSAPKKPLLLKKDKTDCILPGGCTTLIYSKVVIKRLESS